MCTRVIKLYSECFKRQAGLASQDSCSKIQMLNAKCSVLNALQPRYPRQELYPVRAGRFLAVSVDLEAKGNRRSRRAGNQWATNPGSPGNNDVTTLDQDLTAVKSLQNLPQTRPGVICSATLALLDKVYYYPFW